MASTQTTPNLGEAANPAFPQFPQFDPAELPDNVFLIDRTLTGQPVKSRVYPTAAWQGVIRPFANGEQAKLAVRALAADQPVSVNQGEVSATSEALSLLPIQAELRMSNSSLAFDVFALEFAPPAHPWVFSLSPAIAQRPERHHPHLRSDRLLELPSRVMHGFCVYSSAEFAYDPSQPMMEQFLAQVSIWLAKHVIWLRTSVLVNQNGQIADDGKDGSALLRRIPKDTIWQVNPKEKTVWLGFWPGSEAESGSTHLRLDPGRECWCGKGKLYKDCCLLWEQNFYRANPH